MRTKLIIGVILLFGLLFLLNWAAGRYLASLVTHQLDRMAAVDERVEYRYDSVDMNPAFGSLTIDSLGIRHEDNWIKARRITGSLTHADLWRVLRKGAHDPLPQIRSFRIRMEEIAIMELTDADNAPEPPHADDISLWPFSESVMIDRVNILYNGNMDELMQLAGRTRPPEHNHRVSISLDEILFHEEIPEQLRSLPVFSGYRFPEFIDQLTLQIRYRAHKNTASLTSLRIDTPGLYLRTSGDLIYGEQGWPDRPEHWKLDYELDAATYELARLPLPGKMGGFVMDTLSVNSTISFDHTLRHRHPFTLPGETYVYLGDIRWYPSTALTEQYGLIFGMFGLSESELPVQSIRASWSNREDTLRFKDSEISTEPFDATLDAVVAMPPAQRSRILDGSVTFTRTSAAFNDFIDGVEGLFRIELPRNDGQLYFEFSGDPLSPEFDFLDRLNTSSADTSSVVPR